MDKSLGTHKPVDFSAVILVRDDGKILLNLRDNNPNIVCPNQWALPGGGIDKNESPSQAARRELFEETGYDANESLIFVSYICHKDLSGNTRTGALYFTRYDNVQKIQCNEGQKVRFFHPDEILNINFIEGLDIGVLTFIKFAKDLMSLHSFMDINGMDPR